MRPFKFLTNNRGEVSSNTIEFLREYNRRLDYHYVRYHGISDIRHIHCQSAWDLYNRSVGFISDGQITSPSEVRRYLYLSYRGITGVDYEISPMDARLILNETYDYLTRRL